MRHLSWAYASGPVAYPWAGRLAKRAKILDKPLADAYRMGPGTRPLRAPHRASQGPTAEDTNRMGASRGHRTRLGVCRPRTLPGARPPRVRHPGHRPRSGARGECGAPSVLSLCPQPRRRRQPMRPSPSLAYVSTLLDQRRRRHRRVRRLWYASLGLLGLGLLLGGWWVTCCLVHRSASAAPAVSLVWLPALSCGMIGPGGALGAPLAEGTALREPVASQDRVCQPRLLLSVTRAGCHRWVVVQTWTEALHIPTQQKRRSTGQGAKTPLVWFDLNYEFLLGFGDMPLWNIS